MIANLITDLQSQIDAGTLVPDETAPEGYTAYQVAVLLEETYKSLKINKTVKPQYLYNLAKSGSVDGVKHASMKDVRFTEDVVKKFITKMVRRNLTTPTVETTTEETSN